MAAMVASSIAGWEKFSRAMGVLRWVVGSAILARGIVSLPGE
jgi:hypothetical protein